MAYRPTIFPELKGRSWAKVDLGAMSLRDQPCQTGPNPLLDPTFFAHWERALAAELGADFTWGGHFEDQRHLRRGPCADTASLTHLGLDYNVPAGTLVCAPRACTVSHSWPEPSHANGWGARLALILEEPWMGASYLILGHLAHDKLPAPGTRFHPGDKIARTGLPKQDSGWFPHLHAQCAHRDFFDQQLADLNLLDEYFTEIAPPRKMSPDPSFLVGVDS